MEFSSFTLFLTEECNYSCSYCYQKRTKQKLNYTTIRKALDFFAPYFRNSCQINFYGGEPLLAVSTIEQTLQFIQDHIFPKSNVQFSITTNGSLLTDEVLFLLNDFRFQIILSFDGLAQDISRKKDSYRKIVQKLSKIILDYPQIDLMTHSVFTPETVGLLSESIQSIIRLGVKATSFNLSYDSPWQEADLICFGQEMEKLRLFAGNIYEKTELLPILVFQKSQSLGIGVCQGGKRTLSLMADGTLWGCDLFFDFAKQKKDESISRKYSFGNLDYFKNNYRTIYPEILHNHSLIRKDKFRSTTHPCLKCLDLLDCFVCPIAAAFGSKQIGIIPDWVCSIQRIIKKEKNKFWEQQKDRLAT